MAMYIEDSDEQKSNNSASAGGGQIKSSSMKGSTKGSGKGSWKGKHEHRRSMTETKITQALLKKRMEHAIDEKPITFEKILLKFDKLRSVLVYIKKLFNEVAKDGKLDHDGLQDAMKKLHVDMTLDEILDLFDFVNVHERDGGITIKEFLVALTIGMVLDVIPALLSQSTTVVNATAEISIGIDQTFSGFLGHHGEIQELLSLIVTAYLIFDPKGKGYIERKGINETLVAHGNHGVHNNAMLSQERWAEMVSFKAPARSDSPTNTHARTHTHNITHTHTHTHTHSHTNTHTLLNIP
jgi:hypothetical protein